MAGLFAKGYDKYGREAKRRMITNPGQLQADWADVADAVFESSVIEDITGGVVRLQARKMREQMGILETLDPDFNVEKWNYFDMRQKTSMSWAIAGDPPVPGYKSMIDFYQSSTDRIRELALENPEAGLKSWEDIAREVKIEAEQKRIRAAQMKANAKSWDSVWGTFLGMGKAFLRDPIIVGTAVLAPEVRGATLLARIGAAAGKEAAIFGGIEAAVIQPSVYMQKRALDSPYTLRDAVTNILLVSGASFVLRGLGQSASEIAKIRKLAREKRGEAARTGSKQAEAEADTLEEWADQAEKAPEQATLDEHFDKMDEASEALQDGRTLKLDEEPAAADVEQVLTTVAGRKKQAELVDPTTVEVDAKTFQFKAATDAEGVSERLRGLTEWEPIRANTVVIYENRAGRRFIVDGHQRLALAKRALAAGQSADEVKLNAFIFRHADGETPESARRTAALKNIAEGTGTALDAAKVLRATGAESIKDLGLPPKSALVRDAKALAELEGEAFDFVASQLPEEQYAMAAIVGDMVDAGPEQLASIRALVEADPGTLMQARMIVEQIKRAGFQQVETEDLFGGQVFTETLFKERARIQESAERLLKKDTQTFGILKEREKEIVGAGNVLDREANLGRLSEDEGIRQTIRQLANTRGPISDALNDAAQRLKTGERLETVTRDFLESAKRTPAGGYEAGGTAGRSVTRLRGLEKEARKEAELNFRLPQKEKIKRIQDLYGPYNRIAKTHQKELTDAVEEVAEEIGARHAAPEDGYKLRERTKEKALDKYEGDYWRITDITRTTLILNTVRQAEDAVAALARRFKLLDEDWVIDEVNYVDRKILVQYDDGLIGEVQLIDNKMHQAKFVLGGHAIYYRQRQFEKIIDGEKEITDEVQHQRLSSEMRALYSDAINQSTNDWKSLFDSLRPSIMTSVGLTERQARVGAEIDQAVIRPGSRTTKAGIPSQSRQSVAFSRGGAGIDETSTNNIVADNKNIYPDDPDIEDLTRAEVEQTNRLLAEKPDLEVPIDTRINEAGEVVSETRPFRELMDDLDEADRVTDDLVTCMSGAPRGNVT